MEAGKEEKKGLLSRIGDALFVTAETGGEVDLATEAVPTVEAPPAGEEVLTADDAKLLREIGDEVAASGPLLGQFLELAGELREIVPQESASFQAALKALAKTDGASRGDLLEAVERQLAALGQQKETFARSVAGKLDALKATGKKAEGLRARINELQKSIQLLEQEEQQLFAQMTAEEKLVRSAQARFEMVVRTLERDIHGKRDKIRNYLPSPSGDAA